ncbi:MAG: preprotein translocase subunit SecA [Planctomycetota bacterium]
MNAKNSVQSVADIRNKTASFQTLSDRELRGQTDDLRQNVMRPDRQADRHHHRIVALALAAEAVRRVLGWSLYDVQLMAALAMTKPAIAEMQTGEGKTVSAVPAAVWGGIQGLAVHVATPNTYLAERDHQQLQPVFELLGLSVGLVGCDDDMSPQSAYECDITYGPGYEFGFDYLRDQRLLKAQQEQTRGLKTLRTFLGQQEHQHAHRGLGMVLVDEADHVLIDDAVSPQVLSEFQSGDAVDGEAVLLAKIVSDTLSAPEHFYQTPAKSIKLTTEGIQLIHSTGLTIPVELLSRPWTTYVEAAIRARLHFERDVDYVIQEGKVKIVEQTTGRIFDDRSWQSGLHQAIEAKENLRITPEAIPLAQITRQRFFRLYQSLAGMTGTVGNCHRELKTIYGLDVLSIPLRQQSRRRELPFRLFLNQLAKWEAIVQSIVEIHRQKRPILVGTRTIRESVILASRLDSVGLGYQLLNGKQDAAEAEIIAQAGRQCAITIATNLAGRGTDIKLTSGVKSIGGLHVIVSECHESYRADRQLMGRCGRQGDPGSCQTFVAADDSLLLQHASWLAEALQRVTANGESPGEISFPIESRIRLLQRQLENERFAMRRSMLDAATKRNELLLRVRQT